ncbi:MAG: hypothetical protein GX597_02140 [Anaerolineaceae bacterium]|nr:hypothetical protein [Anaerolineaceae bacterium]
MVKVIDQSSDSELGYHNSEPDHVGSSKDPIIVFGDHTCRMYLLIEPFSLGPNTVPFIPNTDVSSYYLYYVLRGLVETHEYKRHWTELCAKRVTLGPLALVQHFSGHAMLLHSEMVVLSRAQRNLRRIRDLLLPRLISGELDVSDLDIHGERVQ